LLVGFWTFLARFGRKMPFFLLKLAFLVKMAFLAAFRPDFGLVLEEKLTFFV
jgi:hypothetical protein